jgi:hypothetical protein
MRQDNPDRNAANYATLDADYLTYDCFTVVTFEDEVVAFSGLSPTNNPPEISRALTRMYYVPDWRRKGASQLLANMDDKPTIVTGAMLSHQVEHARQIGKEHVFISVEFLRRRAFATQFAAYLRLHTGEPWSLLDGMYLTCPAPDSVNCWQNIISLPLADTAFPLPRLSLDTCRKRFNGPPIP